MLLSDKMIKALCNSVTKPMIEPFVPVQINRHSDLNKVGQPGWEKPVISYGLSSYSYDIRLDNRIGLPRHRPDQPYFDPKNFNPEKDFEWFDWEQHKPFYIQSGMFALSRSVETIRVPRNVYVECLGKSTYARSAIAQLVTPLEPEWEGRPTLEITNNHGKPVAVYPGEGICSLVFHWQPLAFFGKGVMAGSVSVNMIGTADAIIPFSDMMCETSYKDRNGKYQGDMTVEGPKV